MINSKYDNACVGLLKLSLSLFMHAFFVGEDEDQKKISNYDDSNLGLFDLNAYFFGINIIKLTLR